MATEIVAEDGWLSDLTIVVETDVVVAFVELALRLLLLMSMTSFVASSLGGRGGLGLVIATGKVFTSVFGSSIFDGADEVDSERKSILNFWRPKTKYFSLCGMIFTTN